MSDMIEFRQAVKRYGSFTAVEGLTFRIPAGRIIGLLGQNGAGKTTTLNMLTGYFPPTSGQVLINGTDMLADPRGCKRMIGYLPEQPPLYDEMTVAEYLSFVCRLREVRPKAIPAHIRDIMNLCGLTDAGDQLLGSMSKGYRQRAGIAQALCGDPPIIVLDEPTIGLDPVQVVEIRALMRNLGLRHTVIFSSHILSEVQQLCDHVLILHKGRLVRECDMAQITDSGRLLRLRATIGAPPARVLPALRSLSCLRRLTPGTAADRNVTEVVLECDADGNPQAELFRLLAAMDAPLL